ncbi:MFS transporter [Candidatus Nitrosacidococcus tergens]|uniref:Inner membrane transport protein YajR n=1 Tax=Candidatus Nitrosacidococcus tergens TaxID=553981 RepID=A0A7G1QBC4_9GAMM|nr:MFS transporter [Candidatus Nitrosacidococcus tergens]CAB1277305.1 Inner membrane transport protein YajR [Candidatus Nitrosacidococcus tergens]
MSQNKEKHFTLGMTPVERRGLFSLIGIYALRMLGLFLILPVFSLYAHDLEGATPSLIGLALGAYGITQAILQIPFGLLSDRIGRKPVITGGLILFAIGSAVAAMATTITGVIIGRALQGSGAIAAAIMALVADLTREEQRTKAMAMIGLSIGVAFAFALGVGPVLNRWIGVPGLFWMTAILAILAIGVLNFGVPKVTAPRHHSDVEPAPKQFLRILKDGQIMRLALGIFMLHVLLTATFVVLPISLRDESGLASASHGYVYLPILILSILTMVPFIILAEKKRRMKEVFVGAVITLGIAELIWVFFHTSLALTIVALWLFFSAFNLLEATLPSLVSKRSPAGSKGTAMGVYSTCQFLGAFIGGWSGGTVYGQFSFTGAFIFGAIVVLLWLYFAFTMIPPKHLRSHILSVGNLNPNEADALAKRLSEIAGVDDAVVVPDEGVAYLKIDDEHLDQAALDSIHPVIS